MSMSISYRQIANHVLYSQVDEDSMTFILFDMRGSLSNNIIRFLNSRSDSEQKPFKLFNISMWNRIS